MVDPSDPASKSAPDAWSALMAAAQDGDQDCYRRLLREITPYLRVRAVQVLRDRSETEDAVQDILLTVHEVRATYDPRRPFTPWLAAIARHRIIDRLRRQGRRAAREVGLTDEHETFAADQSNEAHEEVDGPALRAALASLPAGQRQALEMMKLREMSLKEASAATGLSVGALKVATHRGLRALRHLLAARNER
jgi:RNA polymerase sigma-70 factor (ECF subfamily)